MDRHDRKKRKLIFHVNMLGEFHVPKMSGTSYWTKEVEKGVREGEVPAWNKEPEGQPAVGNQLDGTPGGVLQDPGFADVLQNKPGRTELIELKSSPHLLTSLQVTTIGGDGEWDHRTFL